MTFYKKQIIEQTTILYPKEDLMERMISARQFIEQNYSKSLDLNTICKEACISKYHFIRLFKKYYGQTPHQYLAEVRVKKAKKMIQGGMTIREACYSVGYESMTSFSSLFKKLTGSPPSKIN